MIISDRQTAARLVLLERRDTVAVRDPRSTPVRRYRLARMRLEPRRAARDNVPIRPG